LDICFTLGFLGLHQIGHAEEMEFVAIGITDHRPARPQEAQIQLAECSRFGQSADRPAS
jgi:hypothetical protein